MVDILQGFHTDFTWASTTHTLWYQGIAPSHPRAPKLVNIGQKTKQHHDHHPRDRRIPLPSTSSRPSLGQSNTAEDVSDNISNNDLLLAEKVDHTLVADGSDGLNYDDMLAAEQVSNSIASSKASTPSSKPPPALSTSTLPERLSRLCRAYPFICNKKMELTVNDLTLTCYLRLNAV